MEKSHERFIQVEPEKPSASSSPDCMTFELWVFQEFNQGQIPEVGKGLFRFRFNFEDPGQNLDADELKVAGLDDLPTLYEGSLRVIGQASGFESETKSNIYIINKLNSIANKSNNNNYYIIYLYI